MKATLHCPSASLPNSFIKCEDDEEIQYRNKNALDSTKDLHSSFNTKQTTSIFPNFRSSQTTAAIFDKKDYENKPLRNKNTVFQRDFNPFLFFMVII